jgi:hypothetical protein
MKKILSTTLTIMTFSGMPPYAQAAQAPLNLMPSYTNSVGKTAIREFRSAVTPKKLLCESNNPIYCTISALETVTSYLGIGAATELCHSGNRQCLMAVMADAAYIPTLVPEIADPLVHALGGAHIIPLITLY